MNPNKHLTIESATSSPPPVIGRGRKKGEGVNLAVLKGIGVGGHAFPFSRERMESMRVSARRVSIKLSVRKLPDSDEYAIWRLT